MSEPVISLSVIYRLKRLTLHHSIFMRASTIFALLFFGQVLLFGQQGSLLNREVSLRFTNTSIEEILKSLETEDLSFVYSSEIFDVKKRVSINRKTRLSIVLNELFTGQQMEMREMKGQVLLRKKVIPKPVEDQDSLTLSKQKASVSEPIKEVETEAKDTLAQVTQPVSSDFEDAEPNADSLALQNSIPNEVIRDSVDSFGSTSKGDRASILARTNIFIPRLQIRPYQPYIYDYRPATLDHSVFLKPTYTTANSTGGSVWDEIAETNKKSQPKVKREKPERVKPERVKPERKFRAGLASYTGYTQINNTPSILLGGRVMYYPFMSFGVGVGGNAFLTRGFFNQELNKDIRLEGGYGGLAIEYTLFPQSNIHLNIPVTIGGGGFTYVDADNPVGAVNPAGSQAFFSLEVGAELEINVAKFMKIGFGASYRSVSGTSLLNQSNQQEIISASVLDGMSYGIVLKFGRF